ncbi:MAG: Nif3-like dinuclear metal center hexameric protein [Pyramidobacter sp.]|nr:Nif3-like dinuclear metal center hexameric protein [Pyramidobacter sp.]
MKLRGVMDILDAIAPPVLAEQWDHSGLRLGDPDAEITRIAVALDASERGIRSAASLECELLVTHHPLMFQPPENLVCTSFDARAIAAAFACGVSVAACHTNWDSARGGVNEHLAGLAGLSAVQPLLPPADPCGFGMGAVGDAEASDADDFCRRVARAWSLSGYRLLGESKTVRRAALGGGACGFLWRYALRSGADVFITSDMKYHECLEALDAGLCLMLCDHGEMENPSMAPLADRLRADSGLSVCALPDDAEPRHGRWRSV